MTLKSAFAFSQFLYKGIPASVFIMDHFSTLPSYSFWLFPYTAISVHYKTHKLLTPPNLPYQGKLRVLTLVLRIYLHILSIS